MPTKIQIIENILENTTDYQELAEYIMADLNKNELEDLWSSWFDQKVITNPLPSLIPIATASAPVVAKATKKLLKKSQFNLF